MSNLKILLIQFLYLTQFIEHTQESGYKMISEAIILLT